MKGFLQARAEVSLCHQGCRPLPLLLSKNGTAGLEFHPIAHRVARVEDHRHALAYLLPWTECESATAKRTALSGHTVSPGCSNHPTAAPIVRFYVYLCHHGLDASFAFSDVLSSEADDEEHHDDADENEYAKQEFRKRP